MYSFVLSTTEEYDGHRSDQKLLASLIESVANGDKEALTRLFEITKSAVFNTALAVTRHPHDAEDVAQDTYLQIVRYAATYSGGNPMAWITTVAKNTALMKLRKEKRIYAASDEELDQYCSEHPTMTSDDRETLRTALSILSEEEHEIVVQHLVCGLKHHEIASLLSLPMSTVRSKFTRALAKMKQHLEETK